MIRFDVTQICSLPVREKHNADLQETERRLRGSRPLTACLSTEGTFICVRVLVCLAAITLLCGLLWARDRDTTEGVAENQPWKVDYLTDVCWSVTSPTAKDGHARLVERLIADPRSQIQIRIDSEMSAFRRLVSHRTDVSHGTVLKALIP